MTEYFALEISGPTVAGLAAQLAPFLTELDYQKDLHENFLVFDYPDEGTHTVVTPQHFHAHWDHIKPGPRIKMHKFVT